MQDRSGEETLDSKQKIENEGLSKTLNPIGDPMEIFLDKEAKSGVTDTVLLRRRVNREIKEFSVEIRALEATEHDLIQDRCTIVRTNKRTTVTTKELEYKQYTREVAYAGLINPKLSDPEIQEQFAKAGIARFIKGKEWAALDTFLLPGEVDRLGTAVLRLSGFDEDFVEVVKAS